jgi:hypothetical protein
MSQDSRSQPVHAPQPRISTEYFEAGPEAEDHVGLLGGLGSPVPVDGPLEVTSAWNERVLRTSTPFTLAGFEIKAHKLQSQGIELKIHKLRPPEES